MMMKVSLVRWPLLIAVTAAMMGCATPQKKDYTAYKANMPKSILVLPPVNESPDVNATFSMYSQVSQPLGEAGYYVLPVSLVNETFKQNGLSMPAEMQAVSTNKLQEIFGADAGLYITVTEYGSSYRVISSDATVKANARLVDLKTGTLLWEGSAMASTAENRNNSGGGIAGLLIAAVVNQIMNNMTEVSHTMAGVAGQRLLRPQPNGLLPGHRAPAAANN
jgi:hypothetical protein